MKRQSSASPLFLRGHWIFDLDGTLTLPIHDFAAIRRALGIPANADILGWLFQRPPAEARPLFEQLDAMEAALIPQIRLAPGAFALLRELENRRCRMGILTRNSKANAHATLEALGVHHLFVEESILGRDEAKPKPDPDGIIQLIAAWGASPADTLIVGDYRYDLLAGRAAGVATVHVDHRGQFAWSEHADLEIDSLETIADQLQSVPGSSTR